MIRTASFMAAILSASVCAGGAFAGDDPPAPVTDSRPTVTGAIATPAKDLNLKKTEIPEVLKRAEANTYDTASVGTCGAIAAEIADLDAALGADTDAPPAPVDEDVKERTAATALNVGVQALIPYRGVIRAISGANASDRALASAIRVGFARRGFLKGRAIEMNCPAGASPAGFIQRPELASAPLNLPPAPDLPAAPLFTLPAAPAEATTAVAVPAAQSAPQTGAQTVAAPQGPEPAALPPST